MILLSIFILRQRRRDRFLYGKAACGNAVAARKSCATKKTRIVRVVLKCIFSIFVLRQSRKEVFLCGKAACTNAVATKPQRKMQK